MLNKRWYETESSNWNSKITKILRISFQSKINKEKNVNRLKLNNTKNSTSNETKSFMPLKKKNLKHLESLNRNTLEIEINRQLLEEKIPLIF